MGDRKGGRLRGLSDLADIIIKHRDGKPAQSHGYWERGMDCGGLTVMVLASQLQLALFGRGGGRWLCSQPLCSKVRRGAHMQAQSTSLPTLEGSGLPHQTSASSSHPAPVSLACTPAILDCISSFCVLSEDCTSYLVPLLSIKIRLLPSALLYLPLLRLQGFVPVSSASGATPNVSRIIYSKTGTLPFLARRKGIFHTST